MKAACLSLRGCERNGLAIKALIRGRVLEISDRNLLDTYRALPRLMSQTKRKIKSAAADGAYDVNYCHDCLKKKKIRPMIPLLSGAVYWSLERNQVVTYQRLTGNNKE